MKKFDINNADDFPTAEQLQRELARRWRKKRRRRVLRNIIATMIVVAAATFLAAMLWMPIMQATGSSMEPIIKDGDILMAVKDTNLIERGDIIAFYYNDKVLLKRAIGFPGEVITIDENGDVYINGEYYDEPYLDSKALGACDIELPVTVAENSIFVLGDRRSISVDSRSSDIGLIYDERIIGKIIFRIWPFNKAGEIS